MGLITAIKVRLLGRSSIKAQLASWRRDALNENGAYSFVSMKTGRLEVHHGFPVAFWPVFALSRWNDWVMTASEHRLHKNSYHSWERRNFRGWLAREIFVGTPIGLYVWKYFYWHYWKGLLATSAILCLFHFLYF